MPKISNPEKAGRGSYIAFFVSLAALTFPMCYALYTIATPTYFRAPLYTEIRLVILILGVTGALLGILALFNRIRSKTLAIFAIILGLIAIIQHVLFCGSDALHQKCILFCPILWGIRIP